MNENNTSDVRLDENAGGTVSFATEVIATIAGLAATEIEGVASMSSPSSSIADMFSRKQTKNLTKGVRIDLEGNVVTADITIVVEYGYPVTNVAKGIQENVKKAIETMTGLEVKTVDIHVVGISFEKEQQAAKELDEQQKKMLEESEKQAKAEAEAAMAAQLAKEQEDAAQAEEETAKEEIAEPETDATETEEAETEETVIFEE